MPVSFRLVNHALAGSCDGHGSHHLNLQDLQLRNLKGVDCFEGRKKV